MDAIITPLNSDTLLADLIQTRQRTLSLTADLTPTQWMGPRLSIVNPPLWELGHLAWFQEFWCLRQQQGQAVRPSIIPNADELYNSATVPHASRWDLPLLTPAQTLMYLNQVAEKVSAKKHQAMDDYFLQLAIFHEDMHAEAFTYTRQTLGYASPKAQDIVASSPNSYAGDAIFPRKRFLLGATKSRDFVFDNEKWAHEIELPPFAIARTPVTNEEFINFVEDNGYTRADLWSPQGWTWRLQENAVAPAYWLKDGQNWQRRVFDRITPLALYAPVIHVNWFEADAYCRWAKRRLPTEAEWEAAAALDSHASNKRRYPWGEALPDARHANLGGLLNQPVPVSAYALGDSACGCRQMLGNVWEWTASIFQPYPGFTIDPYKEYSAPWFGTHKVLRGGSFATAYKVIRNTWRNFYTPERRDIFAGFRTCSLEP